MGYKCVLYAEIDEIIIPDPKIYVGGLLDYFIKFLNNNQQYYVHVHGFELGHGSCRGNYVKSAIINYLSQPIYAQRRYWVKSTIFINKPLK